jgi:molecular chaperone HtpG
MSETYQFQAEINQLMSLIINTFYSNKDVFLRELISNSSDALNKIRHESLTNSSALEHNPNLQIRIIPNKEQKTLTIEDDGIGMTKADLINNIGTIARSGSKQFMEMISADAKLDIIGQFGVGFYSAFLVADKVTVYSKNNTDTEHSWESEAGGSFTINPSDTSIGRGTRIVLHMKDDQMDYLNETKLKEIIKKHSQFIEFPINLMVEKEIEVDEKGEDNEEKVGEISDEDDGVVEEDEETKTKKEKKKISEYEHVNMNKPLWTRKPDDVTKDEYVGFYKSLTGDWDEFLTYKHFSIEGQIEFSALLFVPKQAPHTMFDQKKVKNEIKLYVRKVFIMDNCEDLFPEYLNFVRGVVDSSDLPLNVSRETLQQNKVMRTIRKNLVKKTIDMFENLANGETDEEKTQYSEFYKNYSKNIKLGIHEDQQNRDKLVRLLRFNSNKHCDKMISLKTYVEQMKEGQKAIYYITGESNQSVSESPFLNIFKKRDIDCLFLVDPIDEYMVQQVNEFEGFKLVCITKETVDLGESDEEKQKMKDLTKSYEPFCKFVKDTLDKKVEKVVLSNRLIDEPCVITTSQYGWSANMQRVMKAQALGNPMSEYMMGKKIFEIDPNNVIIDQLKKMYDSDKENKTLRDIISLLYHNALIGSGFTLENPIKFTKQINRLICLGLNIDNVENSQSDLMENQQSDLMENQQSDLMENQSDMTENQESLMEQVD